MTAPSRPGLTYWRCPECGTVVGWPKPLRGQFATYRSVAMEERAEQLVEAHEARHGIGAA